MSKISWLHLFLTALISILILAIGSQYAALSFFLGALLIWVTFLIWGFSLSMIFQKKLVAVAISAIVIKYAISGVIIYWLVRKNWLEPLWLALGVFSFAIAALAYSVLEVLKEGRKNGI